MTGPEAPGEGSGVGPAGRTLAGEIDRAIRLLESASRVALACHINPDPDAAGSMLGLAGYLAARGTEVVCSWGNAPFEVPRWMSVLDGAGFVVEPRAFPEEIGRASCRERV